MTHSQMLGKVESGGGPVFKVVLEKIVNIYKKFLSGGFRSKVKIVTAQLFVTPPYFCWQLAFYRHLPTSGRQNTVKTRAGKSNF